MQLPRSVLTYLVYVFFRRNILKSEELFHIPKPVKPLIYQPLELTTKEKLCNYQKNFD